MGPHRADRRRTGRSQIRSEDGNRAHRFRRPPTPVNLWRNRSTSWTSAIRSAVPFLGHCWCTVELSPLVVFGWVWMNRTRENARRSESGWRSRLRGLAGSQHSHSAAPGSAESGGQRYPIDGSHRARQTGNEKKQPVRDKDAFNSGQVKKQAEKPLTNSSISNPRRPIRSIAGRARRFPIPCTVRSPAPDR